MRLLLQENDEPVQLNHWISAELEQDDKILLLRLPSTGGQQIYLPWRQRARNLPLPCMGSNARAADGNTQHKELAIELRCEGRERRAVQ